MWLDYARFEFRCVACRAQTSAQWSRKKHERIEFGSNRSMLIDTHCHLNDAKAFADPKLAVEQARAAGVEAMVVVGVNPADWLRAIELAEQFDDLYALIGWHPNYTSEFSPESMAQLRSLLAHPKVVGLGEIGLDYHWDYAPRDIQHQVLTECLDLASELHVPVVFHAREAYSDLLSILEDRPPHDYLFHCWAGDAEEASRAVSLGGLFGVDGPVTYPKSEPLREVLRTIPLDRLVLETDSPYMSPVPHRGKPNHPANVALVNKGLAAALGISEALCAETTTATARAFFRIPASS